MKTELYINGTLVDLEEQKFKYVLQVNDFFDLKTRQSSFSENIKLPKTTRNIRIFDLAGTYPNNSNVPYQKNFTDYLIDGIPVASDAFGVLKNTNNDYNFHFYDGNIDLYKAIEKLKLTDIPFDEFKHEKTFQTIKDSWDNDLPYIYAIADYGGIPEWDNGINIDFLVPSISLKWLWEKIFEITGFEYEIDADILKNKYFTISDAYKDVSAEGTFPSIVDESKTLTFGSKTYNPYVGKYVANIYFADSLADHITDEFIFTAPTTGLYDIKHTITKTFPRYDLWQRPGIMPQIALTKNPRYNPRDVPSIIEGSQQNVPLNMPVVGIFESGWGADLFWSIQLNAGDKIGIVAIANKGFSVGYQDRTWAEQNLIPDATTTEFIFKEVTEVSLPDYLSDIAIKDIFSEVLIQNALTPILDKQTGVYRFYTLDDRLEAPILDWSEKYSILQNEDYVMGDYGLNNLFTYKYNIDGENHNDGNIAVNNAQLKDENKIESKFYSSERQMTYFNTIAMLLPKFLLWQEDIKETNTGIEVTYKELKNHYHWIDVKEIMKNTKLTSKAYGGNLPVTMIKYADFDKFEWENIINEYYSRIGEILNRMSLIEVEILLSPLDVFEFDFYSRIYIKELSAIFIPNKIIYEPNNIAKVELIKITDYGS